jgi:hypothetical protein
MQSPITLSPTKSLSRSNKKIKFDTDLVLVRILDHLHETGTAGERCIALLECLDEYARNGGKIPLALKEMEDPYQSVSTLLGIYANAMKDHQLSMDLLFPLTN